MFEIVRGKKLLSHQSTKTTEIYPHVSRESFSKIISPQDILNKNKKNDDN